jgi:hypothetical protein
MAGFGGFGRFFARFWGKSKADALLDVAEAHPDDDMDQTLAIDEERHEAERERYE